MIFKSLDLETTELDPKTAKIIQVGIVTQDTDTGIRSVYSQLVNPGIKIDQEVIKLTGITNERLEKAPRFVDVTDER